MLVVFSLEYVCLSRTSVFKPERGPGVQDTSAASGARGSRRKLQVTVLDADNLPAADRSNPHCTVKYAPPSAPGDGDRATSHRRVATEGERIAAFDRR